MLNIQPLCQRGLVSYRLRRVASTIHIHQSQLPVLTAFSLVDYDPIVISNIPGTKGRPPVTLEDYRGSRAFLLMDPRYI